MTAPSTTVIRGIVQVVPLVDRRPWGILRGRGSAKSLWIVPELWKTHRTRFPQLVGRAQNARPHAPQAYRFLF
jgi:hypothetical protein